MCPKRQPEQEQEQEQQRRRRLRLRLLLHQFLASSMAWRWFFFYAFYRLGVINHSVKPMLNILSANIYIKENTFFYCIIFFSQLFQFYAFYFVYDFFLFLFLSRTRVVSGSILCNAACFPSSFHSFSTIAIQQSNGFPSIRKMIFSNIKWSAKPRKILEAVTN